VKIQQEQPYKRMQSRKVPATREVEQVHESPLRAHSRSFQIENDRLLAVSKHSYHERELLETARSVCSQMA